MKDLGADDGFVNNDGYGDQLNLFFSQPPVGLPPLVYPDAGNLNFQLPLSKFGESATGESSTLRLKTFHLQQVSAG